MTPRVTLLSRIEKIARAWRSGLEQAPMPDYMNDFLQGCCGMACDLLGIYLIQSGVRAARFTCGERHGAGEPRFFQSHAWLEFRGITIDITADQFDEAVPPVIVREHSEWHRCTWTINEDQCHIVGNWTPDAEFSAVYSWAKRVADRLLLAHYET